MRRTHWIAAILLIAGCGEGRGAALRMTRDSAGVEIIENARPEWGDSAGWRVVASPVLDLGANGDPHFAFDSIFGLTRLTNGNIAVADHGTHELRFYTASGEFLRSAGREGEGAGEFRSLDGAFRYGADSLIVWDDVLGRWSVLDTAGSFARSSRPAHSLVHPRLLEPLSDGSVLLADERIEPGSRSSLHHVTVLRFRSHDGRGDSLGTYRSFESFGAEHGATMGRMFGSRLVIASLPEGYLVGPAEAYEVLEYDGAGHLLRRIRWQGEDRTVTSADVEVHRARVIASQNPETDIGRALVELLDDVSVADRFPAYSRLVADVDGNLWLSAYARPLREGPRLWTVIDASGRWLGEVALPEALEVWDIGIDYVLGVMGGDVGVERVQAYRLIKEE